MMLQKMWSTFVNSVWSSNSLYVELERLCKTPYARVHSRRHVFPWIISVFAYRAPLMRRTVRFLKNHYACDLARLLARQMHEHLIEELADNILFGKHIQTEKILIIPIPLSKERLRARGFNQATLLARYLSQQEPNWYLAKNILLRKTNTQKQALIKNRQQRILNMYDSFAVRRSKKIRNRYIILVDDVVTTGATLFSARHALLAEGAREVLAITAAH